MPAWLNQFLEQPGTQAPWPNDTGSLYCIIDSVRQPKVLERLYQQDGVTGIERLFQGTPFAALNDVSPLWLPIKTDTALASTAIELCATHRSGILLTCATDPKTAFFHAQRLLRMTCKTDGDCLARFYDPAFWSALALTTDARTLYGPWQNVYTPPANHKDQIWRTWQRPPGRSEVPNEESYPLLLESSTLAASDEIRQWYWVRARQPESANELRDEQLPVVLDNLNLVMKHGIDEGRCLERLLPHLSTRVLQENPDLMNVLNSDMPAFEKVQRLEV